MSTLAEHLQQLRQAEDIQDRGPHWQLLACLTIGKHLSEIEELMFTKFALERLIELTARYSVALSDYDQQQRIIFMSADSWIAHCRADKL